MVANSNAPEKAVPPAVVPAATKPALVVESAAPKPAGPSKFFAQPDAKYGDWRDDLARDGYVVVKAAIPRERADKYANDMFEFLETL
jgi:hypothetical protein